MFWWILIALIVVFGVLFMSVKSGWLTITWVGVDGILIQLKTIAEEAINLDLSVVLTTAQHGYLVLTATLLLVVARVREKIKSLAKPS